MRLTAGRGARIAVAMCAAACSSYAPDRNPEPVVSAGGSLVERQVLDEMLTARRTLEVFHRPERELLFPMFWKTPPPAGHVEKGEVVRVLGVRETYLWRNRLVWLELERTAAPDDAGTVWYRVGRQEWASSNLRLHWDRPPLDGAVHDRAAR